MTNAQMTRSTDSTKKNNLYISFELSNTKWLLLLSDGIKRRQKTIEAGNIIELKIEIDKSIKKFQLAKDVKAYSCYEAGRDGFWLHRFLEDIGVENIVVDSSSIEVNRRQRRAKTDRIDVNKLMNMLFRHLNGEPKLWSVLHVPNLEKEDLRRLDREIERLKKERTSHTNRIKSLLVLHGIRLKINSHFLDELEAARQWDRKPLPLRIKNEILREYKRYKLVQEHLVELRQEQGEILSSGCRQAKMVNALQKLKGIGQVSSWDLTFEFFGWRKFENVKQVGAASGLAPTPFKSGDSGSEQGICKSGNRRVRKTMIEISWLWLRFQPQSRLSLWFIERFGHGAKRMRKVGIVALARKLLVALWKYLDQGLVPEGAVLKNYL